MLDTSLLRSTDRLDESLKCETGKPDPVQQGELVEKLVKVDFVIAVIAVVQHVHSVDDVALGETQTRVQRVDKIDDCAYVDRPQLVTVQHP